MVRRTASQWRILFEKQQESGKTVAQFCRQHKLNAKYFSLKKRKLSAREPSGFIQAKLAAKETGPHRPTKLSRIRVIEFELGAGKLDSEALSSILSHVFR